MAKYVTHRCDGSHSHGEGSGADQYPCEAVRYNDGTIDKTCHEPCSWVMGKSGYGRPPWQINPDGTRVDPSAPDQSAPALISSQNDAESCLSVRVAAAGAEPSVP